MVHALDDGAAAVRAGPARPGSLPRSFLKHLTELNMGPNKFSGSVTIAGEHSPQGEVSLYGWPPVWLVWSYLEERDEGKYRPKW